MYITIPTLITTIRFALVLPIVYFIQIHSWAMAFCLLIIALLSDVIDGFLARTLAQQTTFGACLDPLADKFLIVSCFYALAKEQVIPFWPVWLLAFKELLLIASIVFLYYFGVCPEIVPTCWGKLAACLQGIFLSIVLVAHVFSLHLFAEFIAISVVGLVIISYATLLCYFCHGVRWIVQKNVI